MPFAPNRLGSPASRLFVVLVVGMAAIIIVAAVIGFDFWMAKQPDPSGLAGNVLSSMNQSLSDDEDYKKVNLHVTSITVIHGAGNMFEGQADVATNAGGGHSVPVHIMYDGRDVLADRSGRLRLHRP